jgi:hypothetical protein
MLRRTVDALFRGRQGAARVVSTCAGDRIRHLWTEDEPHPVAGWWRFSCPHCGSKAAVPVRAVGDE